MHAVATTLLLALSVAANTQGQIDLIAKASIPGSSSDLSGLVHRGESCPPDRLGSFGSAIASTFHPTRFIALNDRGPGDGTAAFRCRFQAFDLKLKQTPSQTYDVSINLVATTLLSRADGQAFTGNTGAYNIGEITKGLRLDPEGVRVSSAGTLFISDEYGPWIDEFSNEGRQLRRFAIPQSFLNLVPDGDPLVEAKQATGRQPNRGFEGLAISPDGTTLFAILQSPLIQDGGTDSEGKRQGLNIRILELNCTTGGSRQFIYQLSNPKDGVSEVLAINNRELLVLERDGKSGDEAKRRALFCIDLTNATDVSSITALPATTLPKGITPAAKSLFLDLMEPRFALVGPDMPEKIEGLCFGPMLSDGRHTLIVTTDNDLKQDQPSWFWVFAFANAELPRYQPQNFNPPPNTPSPHTRSDLPQR